MLFIQSRILFSDYGCVKPDYVARHTVGLEGLPVGAEGGPGDEEGGAVAVGDVVTVEAQEGVEAVGALQEYHREVGTERGDFLHLPL